MFGFLALAAFILFVTCIEVTMVMIYFQLCAEDYRWIWKSFLISSSSTWYILGFGIYYYLYKSRTTDLEYMSAVYFFTYLVLGMGAYLVCTGMTGFFASYWFVRKIYGAVKID
jgi:transmembrane 9 superfamily protein 2/4